MAFWEIDLQSSKSEYLIQPLGSDFFQKILNDAKI